MFLHTDFCRFSGWFLLLSSILGFWRVKRWEESVRTPAVPPTVDDDQNVRRNLEDVFGIPIAQPPDSEDNQSRNRQEDSANPTIPLTQSALTQARLARDLRAAGFM